MTDIYIYILYLYIIVYKHRHVLRTFSIFLFFFCTWKLYLTYCNILLWRKFMNVLTDKRICAHDVVCTKNHWYRGSVYTTGSHLFLIHDLETCIKHIKQKKNSIRYIVGTFCHSRKHAGLKKYRYLYFITNTYQD
jgi:hypothetical protein